MLTMCLCVTALVSAQTPKLKRFEGSIMGFANGDGKFGIGGVTPPFFKVNLNRKVSIGAALAPIIWFDTKKDSHSFGTAGFVVRMDYKRISLGYNILTIAGVDTKFIGVGFKL